MSSAIICPQSTPFASTYTWMGVWDIVAAPAKSPKWLVGRRIRRYAEFLQLTGEIRTVIIPKHKTKKLMIECCASRNDFCDLLAFWWPRAKAHCILWVSKAIRTQGDYPAGGLLLCCSQIHAQRHSAESLTFVIWIENVLLLVLWPIRDKSIAYFRTICLNVLEMMLIDTDILDLNISQRSIIVQYIFVTYT
jgi:hypothetical protein